MVKYLINEIKGKNMWDILLFNRFITQDILLFLYYVGVFALPVIIFLSRDYLIQNISLLKKIDDKIQKSLNLKEKALLVVSFFVLLIFFELGWRTMFEIIIGYFDMHDYLFELSQKH